MGNIYQGTSKNSFLITELFVPIVPKVPHVPKIRAMGR
jgi:hypothetical protein